MSVVATPELTAIHSVTSAFARNWICVGDVTVMLQGQTASDICLSPGLETFQASSTPTDIDVEVVSAPSLTALPGMPDFDSGAVWRMFRDGRDFIFDFTTPMLGPRPYKRMHVDRSFRRARISLNQSLLANYGQVSALEYPTDELLITNFLASGAGVEVHGCGLIDEEGKGHLFLGHSGAGKSTTTYLWKREGDPVVLSDDRIILRMKDDGLWMYGTPWHGEAALACNACARLDRIFILRHGTRNEFELLPHGLAVGELFARCFPPFHDADRLGNAIDFLGRVAQRVPCYQFSFVPDSSAVRAAMTFHG